MPFALKDNKFDSYVKMVVFLVLFFAVSSFYSVAIAQETTNAESLPGVPENVRIDTTNAGLITKVAPGELLPISIKLLNFGGGQKVDVTIHYGIFDSTGKEIYASTDTVAVQTTASFIKTIQIPFETLPGKYVAKASAMYQDQLVPATTQFPFNVENKIFGLFQSDFFLYGGISILISIILIFLVYFFIRRQQIGRFSPFDYSSVPRNKRIFFELVSDTIMQMRLRAGDSALEIASHIEGLTIDEKTGRVLDMTDNPSKIIALLVSEYEKFLGQKVSFSFRKT